MARAHDDTAPSRIFAGYYSLSFFSSAQGLLAGALARRYWYIRAAHLRFHMPSGDMQITLIQVIDIFAFIADMPLASGRLD